MGGRLRKKKSLKERQNTILKDPSIALKALTLKTKGFLEDLETDAVPDFKIPRGVKFVRFKEDE